MTAPGAPSLIVVAVRKAMQTILVSLLCVSVYGRRTKVRSSAASNITSTLSRVRGAVDIRFGNVAGDFVLLARVQG